MQTEMKLMGGDPEALRQHFGKKILELEEEKRKVQVKLDIFYQVSHKKSLFLNSDKFRIDNDSKRGTDCCMK